MMWKVCISAILQLFVAQTSSFPFLFNGPRALTSLVSSASSGAALAPITNIADLTKPQKLQTQSLEDDNFFKDFDKEQGEEMNKDRAEPNILRKKINKIIEKIQFISSLANSGSESNSGDDAFRKEQDDFDKEFNEDFVEGSGYSYNKPKGSERQQVDNRINFNLADVGVFFMEVFGSLVGLAYGAAVQLNHNGSTTMTAAM